MYWENKLHTFKNQIKFTMIYTKFVCKYEQNKNITKSNK